MKNAILIIIQLLLSASIIGQKLHSPKEILQILEKSTISYELDVLKEEIPPKDRSKDLNYNNYYRKVDDGKISTEEYELNEEGEKYLKEAEANFRDKKVRIARENYLRILEGNPEYYKVMTYVGQTHGIERDWKKAIKWYEKAIDNNYIDYMAHWFLADAYRSQNKNEKALKEITIAKILNRNNPRINKSFDAIYKLNKLKIPDWEFNPQMKLSSESEKKVKVQFGEDWLGYALAKALWKYEPNYKESMGAKEGVLSTTEDLEALICLISPMEKKKIKKTPEFNAIKKSLDTKMIHEYIFYEIILPEHPIVGYHLSEEQINNIAEYVIKVRGGKK